MPVITSTHKKLLFLLILVIIILILASVWLFIKYHFVQQELLPAPSSTLTSQSSAILTPTSTVSTSTAQEAKTYRNTEFGFEFQYPKNWSFEVNGFYSPFSKFNLAGNSSAENYNPFRPPFLLNIVTPDFADRAVTSFKNLNASTSVIAITGVRGIKYEYKFEGAIQIGIDFPFREYRMILGTEKQYEDIFNQILATFKFLK